VPLVCRCAEMPARGLAAPGPSLNHCSSITSISVTTEMKIALQWFAARKTAD
jgi:hypothetical protein